jgi:hypothetical protein
MKLEIKIDKEIIDFCKLNDLDLPTFIYDCLEKGYIQNKWGRFPMDSIKKDTSEIIQTPKKKGGRKKKEETISETIEQKKSEPVKQTPINDLYGED